MKKSKLFLRILTPMILALLISSTAFATEATESSLDDIINTEQQTEQIVQPSEAPSEQIVQPSQPSNQINNLRDANNYDMHTKANAINNIIKKIASFIVQVVSYFITAFLVVRIILDICYIVLPPTRNTLAGSAAGMGMNMGGMGMNMGMNGMGGMHMGGLSRGDSKGMSGGMNGMQGGMQQQPMGGNIQWVSLAAINAANMEGQGMSALKFYAKDMAIVLIVTPILLVLAITGALTNLGFMIGEVLSRGIAQIGGMM